MINPAQLFDAYEQARAIAADEPALAAAFAPVETMFEDKKRTADAVVMVYGVYNAGKSTLINALLRREAAETGDIPLTDKVATYAWGSYSILDTPGVDAPIAHEDVTREQMLKADAVVFVVDPLGTIEEAKTLEVLLDMVRQRKQIYLVFNEKKPVAPDTFLHLKDAVRQRLQVLADAQGVADVLKEIPISKVNARRALQGYLRDEPLLVELSDFPAFARQLDTFLQGLDNNQVHERLRAALQHFLQGAVTVFEARSASDVVKKYDMLLQRISGERARVDQDMKRELARQRDRIGAMSKVYMRTSPQDCQPRIEALLREAGEQASASLQNQLQAVVSLVQADIDAFQVALPDIAHTAGTVDAPAFAAAGANEAGGPPDAPAGQAPSIGIQDTVQQLGALARPEHIVGSLKMVKTVMPSLMKGIGIKTMEKWGAAIVGKWIPYVGVAMTVGEGLYALFRGDPEAERLREQHAEQQRAHERAVQQMEDFAHELAEGFQASMQAIVAKETAAFFGNVKVEVERLRQGFGDAERENSRQIERWLEIQRLAAGA